MVTDPAKDYAILSFGCGMGCELSAEDSNVVFTEESPYSVQDWSLLCKQNKKAVLRTGKRMHFYLCLFSFFSFVCYHPLNLLIDFYRNLR